MPVPELVEVRRKDRQPRTVYGRIPDEECPVIRPSRPTIWRCGLGVMVACLTGCQSAPATRTTFDAGPSQQSDAGLTDAGTLAGDAGALDSGEPGPVDAGQSQPEVTLGIVLHRAISGSPSPVLVWVTATVDGGAPLSGLNILVDTPDASFAATLDGGTYIATVVPPFTSGELPLWAHLVGSDAGVAATALVLPTVRDAWDQPVPVGGLVNTPGTEDSPTVSPDGQWLIVGTYSPVDLLCCSGSCGGYPFLDGENPACSDALGPVSAPARPGMPGADRVLSSTDINFADALMCAEEPDGGPVTMPLPDGGTYPFALPPVADYGFHRQPDGTYAEPFLIQTGSDGFVSQPFCFTFLGTADAGDPAPVIFGYNLDSPTDPHPHPWFAQLTMGQTDSLGSYQCESPVPAYPTFTPNDIAAVPVGPPGQQAGNTSVASFGSGYYLLSDDESASPPYVEYSWNDGDGGYSDWAPVALPEDGVDRRQPVAVGGRLFYFRSAEIASVAWDGGNPADPASFTDLETELAGETSPSGRVGEVVALGQPTFALIDGGPNMFFVYYRRSATGYDGQIGLVPLR
jgi:hypothetical protein